MWCQCFSIQPLASRPFLGFVCGECSVLGFLLILGGELFERRTARLAHAHGSPASPPHQTER